MDIELKSFLINPDCNHPDPTQAPTANTEKNLDARLRICKVNKDGVVKMVWEDEQSSTELFVSKENHSNYWINFSTVNNDGFTETVWEDEESPKAVLIVCVFLTLFFRLGIRAWRSYRKECREANDKLVEEFCFAVSNYLVIPQENNKGKAQTSVALTPLKKEKDIDTLENLEDAIKEELKKGRDNFFPRKITPRVLREVLKNQKNPFNEEDKTQTIYNLVAANYKLSDSATASTP
jgi:hypothetical protein